MLSREFLLQFSKPLRLTTEEIFAIINKEVNTLTFPMNPQPKPGYEPTGETVMYGYMDKNKCWVSQFIFKDNHKCSDDFECNEQLIKPPYRVQDILRVKEEWMKTDCFGVHDGYIYKATNNKVLDAFQKCMDIEYHWKSSHVMPKDAVRIFLNVTNVRPEIDANGIWVWEIKFDIREESSYKIKYISNT